MPGAQQSSRLHAEDDSSSRSRSWRRVILRGRRRRILPLRCRGIIVYGRVRLSIGLTRFLRGRRGIARRVVFPLRTPIVTWVVASRWRRRGGRVAGRGGRDIATRHRAGAARARIRTACVLLRATSIGHIARAVVIAAAITIIVAPSAAIAVAMPEETEAAAPPAPMTTIASAVSREESCLSRLRCFNEEQSEDRQRRQFSH